MTRPHPGDVVAGLDDWQTVHAAGDAHHRVQLEHRLHGVHGLGHHDYVQGGSLSEIVKSFLKYV